MSDVKGFTYKDTQRIISISAGFSDMQTLLSSTPFPATADSHFQKNKKMLLKSLYFTWRAPAAWQTDKIRD